MVDIDITRHLAELSRIEFTDKELFDIANDMKEIVSLMDKVRDFKEGAKFMQEAARYEGLRADIPEKSYSTEDILKNAEKTNCSSFVVPKVVQ